MSKVSDLILGDYWGMTNWRRNFRWRGGIFAVVSGGLSSVPLSRGRRAWQCTFDQWAVVFGEPACLARSVAILWENKRYITEIETEQLGRVLMLEIGATNVGSVHHTFVPTRLVEKGEEKGYFAFGGSATLTLLSRAVCNWRRICLSNPPNNASYTRRSVTGWARSSLDKRQS